MTYISFRVLIALCGAPQIWASEYCSLTVRIEDPATGKLLSGVPVDVRIGDRIIAGGFSKEGLVRFCDLGFNTYDVHVGGNLCGSVVIRAITPQWPRGRNIRVLYASCHVYASSLQCLFLLRVPSARCRFTTAVASTPADSQARIFLEVPRGQTLAGTVLSDAGRREVRIECPVITMTEHRVDFKSTEPLLIRSR